MNFIGHLAKDYFLYTLSKLIPGVLGMLFLGTIIKLIGISEYGKYSLLISQFNLIVAFSFGWLNQSELRYNNYSDPIELNNARLFFIFYSLSIVGILLYFFFFFKINQENSFFLYFIIISLMGIFSYLKTIFQANFLSTEVVKITVLQSILMLILPILLFNYNFYVKNYMLFIYSTFCSFLFSIVILMIQNYKFLKTIFSLKKNRTNNFEKWFKYGFPISVWSFFGLLLPFLDRFFINRYFSNEFVGNYSSMNELIVRSFSLTVFPFIMAIHPRLTKLWNNGNKIKAIKIIIFFSKIFLIAALLLAIILYFMGSLIHTAVSFFILFTIDESKNLIFPLAFAGITWQFSLLLQKVLELQEKSYLMVLFIFFSLIINLLGNTIFLPKYGITATAYTSFFSALSYCLLIYLYIIYTRSFRKI